MSNRFLRKVTEFHDRELPEEGILVGYGFLLNLLEEKTDQQLPMPESLSIVTEKQQRYDKNQWQIFGKSYMPSGDELAHLVFALKYEGIDLLIIKEFFTFSDDSSVKTFIMNEPTGKYSRQIWFLYEWLLNKKLDIPDLKRGTYAEIVDSKLQYPGPVRNSTRHRVKNNLPGTVEFCPMIRKTKPLEKYISTNLPEKLSQNLFDKNKDLIHRTAAFLLLKDSKASFSIEGEHPPSIKARNWGVAIGAAGKTTISIAEIERLQKIIIGKKPLEDMGIRNEEGFIGTHDRETFEPIPDHISAKAKDLPSLLNGLTQTNKLLQNSDLDPVLTAAVISFGFVFIHPLSDGNGRLHRYLIHHILARMGYNKQGLIFPVSAAILNNISKYQNILEAHSMQRLPLIKWKTTASNNIEIQNDTIDLYRYFDATSQAEFLYQCVEETIEEIIPKELDFMEKYDRVSREINSLVDLPNTKLDLLIKLLHQNEGRLSNKRRTRDFNELSDIEIKSIEKMFSNTFKA